MNYDYCSSISEIYDLNLKQKVQNIEKLMKKIDKEKEKEKKEKFKQQLDKEVQQLLEIDHHVAYHLLAVKHKDSANTFRSLWQSKNLLIDMRTYKNDEIFSPSIDMSLLPEYSFLIQFRFTLEKPYISRGDQEFYIIDNPIRKDKVLGLPYVAPSSWKGSLRASLWQNGHKEDDAQIIRIFGNERGVEEHTKLKAGRLHLFPTFFNRIGLEIINPHDREKRVGKNPILMESVPIDTSGLFTALYVPYNIIGNDVEMKNQVAKDIELIATGLKAMFRDCGFGAKTSSGYGQAKNELECGNIVLKAKGIEFISKDQPSASPPEETFRKYINDEGIVKDEFKGHSETGLLSNREYNEKGQGFVGGSLAEFKKFRHWYGHHGEKWQKELRLKNASTDWPTWNFDSFDNLLRVTEEIDKSLLAKEGQ